MKIFFRILAIVLALSVFGNLIASKIFIAGILLTILFAYLGWRPTKKDVTIENKPK